MSIEKLALGTAQFGLDYGLNNKRGKIPQDEAISILHEAINAGVEVVDTASSYGEAEKVLGYFVKETRHKLKIISKLPNCEVGEVAGIVDASLERMNIEKFYGYLIHDFRHYIETPGIFDVLEVMKSEGKVEKIGFSLYYPRELDYLLENKIKIDLVQVPCNIFDQRFFPYFEELKRQGVEVFVRSVFLQGLIFKQPSKLDLYFNKIKNKLETLNILSKKNKVSIAAMCLNFAVSNELIDRVVVGVDNLGNLKEIIQALEYGLAVKRLEGELLKFREDDESIIVPSNWDLARSSK